MLDHGGQPRRRVDDELGAKQQSVSAPIETVPRPPRRLIFFFVPDG